MKYIQEGEKVHYNVTASENWVELSVQAGFDCNSDTVDTLIGSYPFMLEYNVTESGFTLSENIVKLYKEKGNELLKKLNREEYNNSNIIVSIYPNWDNMDYLKNNNYTVTIMLSFYPTKRNNISDTLLELYSFNSYVSLTITYFSKSGLSNIKIREYNSDWLSEEGQFEIIPLSEAQTRFDNDDSIIYGNDDNLRNPVSDIPNETWDNYVNADIVKEYGVYLVYVKDIEGYIRPLYMKQDYYSVGRLEGAAWIDAIDY